MILARPNKAGVLATVAVPAPVAAFTMTLTTPEIQNYDHLTKY